MANYLVPKDEFWAVTLKANNLTKKDVAALWGTSLTTATQNLNGTVMPTAAHIKSLCEYCQIDIEQGTQAFKNLIDARVQANAPTKVNANPKPRGGMRVKGVSKATAKTTSKEEPETDNFWIQQMCKAGLTYVALGKKIGNTNNGIRSYIVGYRKPSPEKMRQICDVFNVPYSRGFQEFERNFKQWGEDHADKFVCAGTYYVPKSSKKKLPKEPTPAQELAGGVIPEIPVDVIPESKVVLNIPDYVEPLYGIVPFKVFQDICINNVPVGDLLEVVYGKVDFDVYMRLAAKV